METDCLKSNHTYSVPSTDDNVFRTPDAVTHAAASLSSLDARMALPAPSHSVHHHASTPSVYHHAAPPLFSYIAPSTSPRPWITLPAPSHSAHQYVPTPSPYHTAPLAPFSYMTPLTMSRTPSTPISLYPLHNWSPMAAPQFYSIQPNPIHLNATPPSQYLPYPSTPACNSQPSPSLRNMYSYNISSSSRVPSTDRYTDNSL